VSEYRDSLPAEQVPAYDEAVKAAGAVWAQVCADYAHLLAPAAAA
jgi:hypothetical protein